ncbi:hypothetical protein PHMEG_0009382 [Phytophthora megakarya]|uniref:Uncharacterized protein n=1 Tax=Phytophthora megakarya TaxID=4795 RepID=A0A225WGD2_9STRA|nr:hypothetical protein PHMEG_0009382 [Phytophthora megakarya]
MNTPVSPRGETAQDLGASKKRLQVVDLLGGSISDSDRPSISAVGDFNTRNATQNLLSTWLAKSTLLMELDQADAKARSIDAATPSAIGQVPPALITSPPTYSSCSTTQFVGVPAFDVDRLGTVLLRAGYGGLDNLVEIEHLSNQDRSDLSKLRSEDQNIQRELLMPRDASVELRPSGFYSMVSGIPAQRELAKRILDKHRVSLVSCTLGTSKTTLELGNSSDEARCAHRGFALLEKAFNQQVAEILEQAQCRLSGSGHDFRRAAEEHTRQEQVLRDENAELQRQIDDYRLVNRQLEDRLRGGTFKVGRVMNYLNRHNARVSGNWPHLKALLEKFKDGSLPPDAWKTQIQINAADEFDATQALTSTEWRDKLHADLQELMRSHMSYDDSLADARTDAEIHSHLDARALISMLVRIIYWKSLDKTRWVKSVPCWRYKEAESKLAKVLTLGEVPTCRPDLRKDIRDDAVEIMSVLYDSVTEEEDDEGRDATFSPGEEDQNKTSASHYFSTTSQALSWHHF